MPFSIKLQLSDLQRRLPRNQIGKPRNYDPVFDALVRCIRDTYLEEILTALHSTRYHGDWEPKSESYLEYRKQAGLPDSFCDMEVAFQESLIYYRVNYTYLIGIDSRYFYRGSRVLFQDVCRWLEYGITGTHARPLLLPARRKTEHSVDDIIETFLNAITEGDDLDANRSI